MNNNIDTPLGDSITCRVYSNRLANFAGALVVFLVGAEATLSVNKMLADRGGAWLLARNLRRKPRTAVLVSPNESRSGSPLRPVSCKSAREGVVTPIAAGHSEQLNTNQQPRARAHRFPRFELLAAPD